MRVYATVGGYHAQFREADGARDSDWQLVEWAERR